MIAFDWSVSLGQILILVGWVVWGVWFASRHDFRLKAVEASVENIADILRSLSRQDAQIEAINQRISDLPCRRGSEDCPSR